MKRNVEKAPSAVKAIIVFGLLLRGRAPVAAKFAEADRSLAMWVAHHQGLTAVALNRLADNPLLSSIPDWQLRPDKGLRLTTVTLDTFAKLQAATAATNGDAKISCDGSAADWSDDWLRELPIKDDRSSLYDPVWAAMDVRNVVLAAEYDHRGAVTGWWDAVILAIHGESYTICWLDDTHTGFRTRQRHELAPLHPAWKTKMPGY
jgi:hypothetical protein